jgi:hypothetical protein
VRCPAGSLFLAAACLGVGGVALLWRAPWPGAVAGRGSRRVCPARNSVARPGRQGDRPGGEEVVRVVDRVVIGAGPRKLSVTFGARDAREILRATGRFGTDPRQLPAAAGGGAAVAGADLGGGGSERDRPAAGAAAAGQWGAGAGRACQARRPREGLWTPGRAARPTPRTRTRSPWPPCGQGIAGGHRGSGAGRAADAV